MNDKDFEDIGKRLYDLEAEPANNAWARIKPEITPDDDPEKGGYFYRNWWKPLVLILPLSVYLLWPMKETAPATSADQALNNTSPNATAPAVVQEERQRDAAGTIAKAETTESSLLYDQEKADGEEPDTTETAQPGAGQKGKADALISTEKSISKAASARRGSQSKNAGQEKARNGSTTASGTSAAASFTQDVPLGNVARGVAAGTEEQKNAPLAASVDTSKKSTEGRVEDESRNDAVERENNASSGNQRMVAVPANETRTNELIDKGVSHTNEGENLAAVSQVSPKAVAETESGNLKRENEIAPNPDERIAKTNGSDSKETSPGTDPEDKSSIPKFHGPVFPARTNSDTDAAGLPEEKFLTPVDTVVSSGVTGAKKEKNFGQTWRVSFIMNPQFVFRTYRPEANDDILVTGVNKGKALPERAGFGLGFGIGKAINSNIYLDGHITLTRLNQDLSFNYSDGRVDTLLSTLLPDGSVAVSPVYRTTGYERTEKLTMGGVRIGATYYFWNNGRRRFNFAASAGMNYVLASRFTESGISPWGDTMTPAKALYNFSAGAGYSVLISRGWELLVNPNVTYFADSGNNQSPVGLNQRSYGVNLMLSKALFR